MKGYIYAERGMQLLIKQVFRPILGASSEVLAENTGVIFLENETASAVTHIFCLLASRCEI